MAHLRAFTGALGQEQVEAIVKAEHSACVFRETNYFLFTSVVGKRICPHLQERVNILMASSKKGMISRRVDDNMYAVIAHIS